MDQKQLEEMPVKVYEPTGVRCKKCKCQMIKDKYGYTCLNCGNVAGPGKEFDRLIIRILKQKHESDYNFLEIMGMKYDEKEKIDRGYYLGKSDFIKIDVNVGTIGIDTDTEEYFQVWNSYGDLKQQQHAYNCLFETIPVKKWNTEISNSTALGLLILSTIGLIIIMLRIFGVI